MTSTNKDKIISLLLHNPLSIYNINQISRVLHISVGSTYKIIKQLESGKITKNIKLGNAIYYRLDFSNPKTEKIASLILIQERDTIFNKKPIVKVYGQEIQEIGCKIAILFGSILTKRINHINDIDVLFVVQKKQESKNIYKQCLNISKFKTKPIVPLILTKKEFKKKIEEKESIILEVIKQGVVLSGEDELIKIFNRIRWQI